MCAKSYRIILILCSVIMLCSIISLPASHAFASNEDGSALRLNSTLSQDKTEVVVELDLTSNIGLSMMLLTLDYDTTVFKLINVERGTALSTMDFKTTSTDYSVSPYKLMWSDGLKNNMEKGVIAKLTFAVASNIQPNSYPIAITYRKGTDIVRYNNLNSPTYVDIALKNSTIDLTVPEKLNLNWIWQVLLALVAIAVIIFLLRVVKEEKCFAKRYETLQLHKRKSIHAIIFELIKYKGSKIDLKWDRLRCFMADEHLFDVVIKNNNPMIQIAREYIEMQGKGKLKPAVLEIRQLVENTNPLELSEYSKNPNSGFIHEMCLQYLEADKQNKENKNKVNKSRIEFYCN